MNILVLGSSGSESPGHNPPAFLVDGFLLMDAGTVSLSLTREEQCRITHVLLTHAHLDHIKGIPFLVDNLVTGRQGCRLSVLSGRDVLSDLSRNIFNDRIWPDFTAISISGSPVMSYRQISTQRPFNIRGYTIVATRVNHSVPSYGYIVRNSENTAIGYTGDTGPTDRFWKRMAEYGVETLIVEVSFPDEMTELAMASGHLTPSLLQLEIRKMRKIPERIYITHLKPFHETTIREQLCRISEANIQVLHDGMQITV
jgi:ribonuclease BN (tRNA processing enzyme)